MTDEIVAKLQKLLGGPGIDDEYRVVYLLTQLRKISERDKIPATRNLALDFYCNWALHTSLSRNPGAMAFLTEVDSILTLDSNTNQAQHERVNSLLTLGSFRSELHGFLRRYDINSTLCDSDECWRTFLVAYSRVIENCEISIRVPIPAAARGPLQLSVKSVSISAVPGRRGTLSESATYPMEWSITYADGRRGQLSLSNIGLPGAILILSNEGDNIEEAKLERAFAEPTPVGARHIRAVSTREIAQ